MTAALLALLLAQQVSTREGTHRATCVEIAGDRLTHDGRTSRCADVIDVTLPHPPRHAGAVQIALWNGDVVHGDFLEPTAPDTVRVRSAALGDVSLALDGVESVRHLARRAAWPRRRPPGPGDIVVTRTGDVCHAKRIRLGANGIDFFSPLRDRDIRVAHDDATIVYLTGKPVDAPNTLFAVIELTDGSTLQGTIAEMKEALVFTDLRGAAHRVAVVHVRGFQFRNGCALYLSDAPADRVTAVENANYLRDPAKIHPSDKAFPWQRDRNVKWGRLSIRDQEFRKGIGVHSKSELTFDVAGAYATFEAMVGIDDCARDAECGSVVFAVLADGRKIWDSGPVTWRDRAKSVSVPIAGAQKLTLLVDWGDDFESGDHADWALARVIR